MSAAENELDAAAVPAIKPRLAASLILVDRSQSEPKILFGLRNAGHVFVPGKFVFPGGGSEPEDLEMTSHGSLAPQITRRLSTPACGDAIAAPGALALTAIRELFEETGFLLGEHAEDPISAPPGTSWVQFAAARVIPNLSKLHYVARALTPPGAPRRFDTHFFAADAQDIAATIDGKVNEGSELVELRWATAADLSALDLLPVTVSIATELARRLKAGLGHDLPVPYFYTQDKLWIRAEV